MAQETLKITITADNKEAVQNIQGTIVATQQMGQAFSQIPQASNQAGLALNNLSRIAQDAPYGFLGISNNINPMLESFQRLQASTGSTSAALKAMVSSLTGPAGVGLAVGAISSLLVVFGDRLFSHKKAVDESKVAQEEFAKSLDKAQASALSHAMTLQNYISIAENVNVSDVRRKEALDAVKEALSKVNKTYADSITNVNQAKNAVELYTQALIQQAIVERYKDEIADKTIKLTKVTSAATIAAKDYNEAIRMSTSMTNGYVDASVTQATVIGKAETKYVDLANSAVQLSSDIDVLNKSMQDTIVKSLDNPFTVLNKDAKQAATSVQSLTDETKAYIREYEQLTRPTRAEKRKATPLLMDIAKGETPDKLSTTPPAWYTDTMTEKEKKAAKDQEEFNTQLKIGAELTSVLAGGFNNVFEAFVAGKDISDALSQSFQRIVVQLIEMVAQALIFKAIMSLLTGGGSDFAQAATSTGLGMGGGNILGEFLLRGSDLVLASQRANSNLTLRR
jgi:hypothetical protein